MDVLNTLVINDVTYKLTNTTEYHLDQWLDSSYGFEIYFRKRRGIEQVRWLELLDLNFFDTPEHLGKGIYQSETRASQLDFTQFVARPFVFYWTLGDNWYGLGFDKHEFVMQDNDGKAYLPHMIL